jgi:hypothetical protein
MDISNLVSNVNLESLVKIDEERFAICNIKIDDISFVLEEDNIILFYKISTISDVKLKNNIVVNFVFYSKENKIMDILDSRLYQNDFYKYEIIKETIYFNNKHALKSFCSNISSIKIYVKND